MTVSRPRVLLTRPIPSRGLARLEAFCEVVPWSGPEPMPREALEGRLPEVDAVLAAVANRFDASLLATAPRLRVIANMGVGFDNVDLAAAKARGIVVTNTPDVVTETTADMAFGLLLAAARRIVEASTRVRGGAWTASLPAELKGIDAHGTTLGIVGFGRIGRAMARRARGFAMRVLFVDPVSSPEMDVFIARGVARRVDLPTLLVESDFVSLHPSLDSTSRRMIDAEALAAMKRTAVLVNTSRGPVVDTDALVAALEAGTIGGCALDVTDPEPLPPGHPLLAAPNAIVTPHMSTQTHETREAMCDLAARNVVEVLAGRPPITPVPMP